MPDDNSIIELGLSVSIEGSENEDVKALINGLKAIGDSITVSGGTDEEAQEGINKLRKGQNKIVSVTEEELDKAKREIGDNIQTPTDLLLSNQKLMLRDLRSISTSLLTISSEQMGMVHQLELGEALMNGEGEFPAVRANQWDAVLARGGEKGDDAQEMFEETVKEGWAHMIELHRRGDTKLAEDLIPILTSLMKSDWTITDYDKLLQKGLVENMMKQFLGLEDGLLEKTVKKKFTLDDGKEYEIGFETREHGQLKQARNVSTADRWNYLDAASSRALSVDLYNARDHDEGMTSTDVLKDKLGMWGEKGLLNKAVQSAEGGAGYDSLMSLSTNVGDLKTLLKGSELETLIGNAAELVFGENNIERFGYTKTTTYGKKEYSVRDEKKGFNMREIMSAVAALSMKNQMNVLIDEAIDKGRIFSGVTDRALLHAQNLKAQSDGVIKERAQVVEAPRDLRLSSNLAQLMITTDDVQGLAEQINSHMKGTMRDAGAWVDVINLVRSMADKRKDFYNPDNPVYVELKALGTTQAADTERLRSEMNTVMLVFRQLSGKIEGFSAALTSRLGVLTGEVTDKQRNKAERSDLRKLMKLLITANARTDNEDIKEALMIIQESLDRATTTKILEEMSKGKI